MMTVYDLITALGGEIVLNRASVRRGSEYLIIGEMLEGELALTDEGRKLIESLEVNKPKPKARTRRFTPDAEGDEAEG